MIEDIGLTQRKKPGKSYFHFGLPNKYLVLFLTLRKRDCYYQNSMEETTEQSGILHQPKRSFAITQTVVCKKPNGLFL